ncbi:MAG: hypothetical protein JW712_03845 [Dehalococcoidales bacterium]|nr:hypothetical protein [Dehalococcoidales bacterium]
MTKEWAEMTPEEKREVRFKKWLDAEDIEFVSPEAKEKYRERVSRLIKVVKMEKPDRIPLNIAPGAFPAIYRGGTLKEHMYDFSTVRGDFEKFHNEFDMDFAMAPLAWPGKLFDIIDFKLMQWPGHGVPDDGTFFQYVEGVYMPEEEYDELINCPNDFYLRKILPRISGTMGPLQMLARFNPSFFVPVGFLAPFGMPEFQEMLKKLQEAAGVFFEWAGAVGGTVSMIHGMGFPTWGSSLSLTAYDMIADFLRGTRGIMADMYRCPDKLLEAIEKFTPMTIELGLSNEATEPCPIIFIPLHKGADTWMSNKQFEKFYWPCLKKLMMGLYEEGFVPFPLAEATYNNRLEIISDVPKGSVMWWFENVDMKRAKDIVGRQTSIAGGVQTSLLSAGTGQDIKDMVKQLVDDCGKDGGYMMSVSASVEQAKAENLHTLFEAVKEYGNY